MEELKKNSKLVIELKEMVEDYLKKFPSLSIHSFSKKCGVASSTLRRILSLETKEDPVPSTVLGIISAVKKESNIHRLMELFDKNSEVYLSLDRSYSFANKHSAYRPDLGELLKDRENYIIYKLAANAVGTTREHLVDLLGNPAIEKIDELIKSDWIYEEGERLHAIEKNFTLSVELGKKYVPEMLRYAGAGSKYVDKKMFRSVSESITNEVYEEIWRIQSDAAKKIISLINRKESIGEIPFFYIYVLDTMEAPGRGPDSEAEDRG
ncbi:MAG: hypothetical protein HQK49_02965 [Oligoflexia bacterium]|nr:hypothetical protein [Oligoflexia bacterium]